MVFVGPTLAQAPVQAKVDFAALTPEFYGAVIRGDAAAAGRLLCAQSLVISPRGLVSARKQFLGRM